MRRYLDIHLIIYYTKIMSKFIIITIINKTCYKYLSLKALVSFLFHFVIAL